MAEKRSTALHREGVPLDRAWIEYASAEERERFEGLPEWHNPPSPNTAAARDVLGFFVEVATRHQTRKTAEDALKRAIVRQLGAGHLEALGYRFGPHKSHEPVVIGPFDDPDVDIDWKAGTVAIAGEEFRSVRIIRASARPTGRKRGRPGSNAAILRIIETLIAESGGSFCDLPRGTACAQIIAHAEAEIGKKLDQKSQAGFSEPNLNKLILQRCPKRRI